MGEEIGRNQRNRERETNRETNRSNMLIDAAVDEDDQLPLSLTLGSTSYSSQIQAMSSLSLDPPPPLPSVVPSSRPPPISMWPADLMDTLMPSYYFMPPPVHLSPPSQSNSFQQTRPLGSLSSRLFPQPQVSFFPPSAFTPPPNHIAPTRPRVVRPLANRGIRIARLQPARNQNAGTITPPFPWATNRRGQIHSLEYLQKNQITTITGLVQCKHCDEVYQISYNLRERFELVERIFMCDKRIMRQRAPKEWENPQPRRCELCGREKSVKPVIAKRKSQINWLFLLLGQMLGFCTLEQLKNFCKHAETHRTGAKDRVLYSTYLRLCGMLEPEQELFREIFKRRFR